MNVRAVLFPDHFPVCFVFYYPAFTHTLSSSIVSPIMKLSIDLICVCLKGLSRLVIHGNALLIVDNWYLFWTFVILFWYFCKCCMLRFQQGDFLVKTTFVNFAFVCMCTVYNSVFTFCLVNDCRVTSSVRSLLLPSGNICWRWVVNRSRTGCLLCLNIKTVKMDTSGDSWVLHDTLIIYDCLFFWLTQIWLYTFIHTHSVTLCSISLSKTSRFTLGEHIYSPDYHFLLHNIASSEILQALIHRCSAKHSMGSLEGGWQRQLFHWWAS